MTRAVLTSWRVSRQWHQGALSVHAWRSTCCLGVVALACAAAWFWQERAALRQTRQNAQADTKPQRLSEAPAPIQLADFAKRLPVDSGTAQWVGDFQRAAAKLGVTLASLSDTPRPAQPDQLGRHEIQLTLRGSYPPIKLLLKETLDRHPHTTVARLNMRSLASPSEVEATVSLIVWSRPGLLALTPALSR